MLSGNTEILSEVYYLDVGGNGMLSEECLALAMAEAQEDYIDSVETVISAEPQVTLPHQPLMNIAHEVAGVTLGVSKDNLCLRVVEQQANQFTPRIASSSENSYTEPTPNPSQREGGWPVSIA